MTKPIPDKAEIALEYPDKPMLARLNAHRDLRRISIQPALR